MDDPESIIISTHMFPNLPCTMAPCDLTAATTTLGTPQLQLCTHEGLTAFGGAPSPIEAPRSRFPNDTH